MLYFLTDLLVLGCINSIMVVGLNLQYGYSGLLNFAYYIYVAIGAYIAAITTMGPSKVPGITYALGWTLPWWAGLIIGGIVSAIFGTLVFLLTVRRLRSDYLAIVTVAVAFIMWNLIDTYQPLFDGDTGLFSVPQITGNAHITTEGYSVIILALSAACLALFVWTSRRIFRSPFGRLLRSIREDEQVTAAFGRITWKPQIAVFTIGSFLAGIAGGLLIFYISAWSPPAFLPLESFVLLAALIVGGSGNYWGSLLGAFVLIEGLAEIARYVPSFGNGADVGALRQVVIGLVLILTLRYRPEGIIPERWLKWYRTKSPAGTPAESPAPAVAVTPAAAISRTRVAISWLVSGNTPAVGSSISSSRGWAIRARAISISRRWPPDSEPAGRSRWLLRPSQPSSSTASSRSAVSWSRQPRCQNRADSGPSPRCAGAAIITFSSTGRCASTRAVWNVRATPSRDIPAGLRPPTLCPSSTTSPDCGVSRPLRISTRVDLPAPFGPISPVTVPRLMLKLQSATARAPP